MTKTAIAAEYCRKFRTAPNAVIARVMYKECPEAFKDVEDARGYVRLARGSRGNQKRHLKMVDREENPLKLPEPDYVDYPVMHLEGNRFAVLPDVHAPYHDLPALTLALQHSKRFNPDHVVANGDWFDMYRISRHQRDPRKRDLAGELKIGRKLFERLRKIFPKAKITLKKGNHDLRWESYLMDRAPELLGIDGMALEQILRLHELDIEVVGGNLILMMGNLPMLHGHEWQTGISAPVNPARGAFLKAKAGVVVSHSHQVSEHSEPNMFGKLITCWSTGCLCQLHPEYARINKWGHGFLLNEVDKDGAYLVQNKRIYQGKVW